MPRLSERAANAAADAVTELLDGGALQLYGDTKDRPLARVVFGRPAFKPAHAGTAEAHALREDARATGGGTARRFAAVSATGQVVFEGRVGERGDDQADLTLNSTFIAPGALVVIQEFRYRVPLS